MPKEQKIIRPRDLIEEWQRFCEGKLCGFCSRDEQGKHGEIRREWLSEFKIMVPVCRKHTLKREGEDAKGAKGSQAV